MEHGARPKRVRSGRPPLYLTRGNSLTKVRNNGFYALCTFRFLYRYRYRDDTVHTGADPGFLKRGVHFEKGGSICLQAKKGGPGGVQLSAQC